MSGVEIIGLIGTTFEIVRAVKDIYEAINRKKGLPDLATELKIFEDIRKAKISKSKSVKELYHSISGVQPPTEGLDSFRASFNTVYADRGIPYALDALGQLDLEDIQSLTLDLLSSLQSLRTSRLLGSSGSSKNLFSDLSRLNSTVNSNNFDLDRIKPLLTAALANHLDDALI
ncbi:hypothetical protein B0I37DRAFT_416983 [Chaetomium sp. MPI-CAGE-AT-0009]|nr:hypothetical protein B0I37DRAFT_416983 [Chaetomium sp. MPI-CAGE-AT-0009]